MRAAPAVRVIVQPGGWARGVPAVLSLFAAGSLAAWGLGHAGWPLAWAMPAAALGAGIAWRASDGPAVELSWDGQHWRCDGRAGVAAVQLDLSILMLVRWQASEAPAGTRWLLPTARQCGVDWHGLRVALLSGSGPARLDPPVSL